MRAGAGERLQSEVASVLDWWSLAGVSTAAAERPRDWLAPAAPVRPAAAVQPAAAALPATLPDYLAWLASHDDGLLGPATARVAPVGQQGAALMVLIEMPGPDDADDGLMSDGAGQLLDAMLRAMGTSREAVWLAPLSPCRPAGGRIDAARTAELGRLARHHVALAAPRRLLLMGQCAAEAVLGVPPAEARGRVHDVGDVPAVATFSPHVLLKSPRMKPGAWADLRLLMSLGEGG